jgi:hypothetical protein
MAAAIDEVGRGGVRLAPEITDHGERIVSLRRVVEGVRSSRTREAYGPDDWVHMADTIDRTMRLAYLQSEFPTSYEVLGHREDSRSFEDGKSYEIYGVRLAPEVARGADYPSNSPKDRSYTKTLKKFGWTWPLPWESWVRDQGDLRLLASWPRDWGLSARYSMEYRFTSLWAGNTTYFSAGNGNYVEGAGTSLSETSLKAAIAKVRSGQRDAAGNEVPYYGPLYLVVPPSLEFTARELVESPVYVGGSSKMPARNSMQGSAKVVLNPLLPIIDTTQGETAWYLWTDPNWDRPAVRYGFLLGSETPEIFVREADARSLLGGGSDVFRGALSNDSIEFKLRFTFGCDLWDVNGAYMSKGAA